MDMETRFVAIEEMLAHVASTLDIITTKQAALDDSLATLVGAQIKTQEQFRETDVRFRETDARFRDTEARFRETEARFRETDSRFRETDSRIDRLVSGIGEFIRIMSERKQ